MILILVIRHGNGKGFKEMNFSTLASIAFFCFVCLFCVFLSRNVYS